MGDHRISSNRVGEKQGKRGENREEAKERINTTTETKEK